MAEFCYSMFDYHYLDSQASSLNFENSFNHIQDWQFFFYFKLGTRNKQCKLIIILNHISRNRNINIAKVTIFVQKCGLPWFNFPTDHTLYTQNYDAIVSPSGPQFRGSDPRGVRRGLYLRTPWGFEAWWWGIWRSILPACCPKSYMMVLTRYTEHAEIIPSSFFFYSTNVWLEYVNFDLVSYGYNDKVWFYQLNRSVL